MIREAFKDCALSTWLGDLVGALCLFGSLPLFLFLSFAFTP